MIVLGIVLLLAALAYPAIQAVRGRTMRQMCINNLRQIYYAKEQWALARGKCDGDDVDSDQVDTYIKDEIACPAHGEYQYRQVGDCPTCDITGHALP